MTPQVALSYVEGEGGHVFETFSRDIVEVKVETDSRAVAVAVIKNTTPIPAGAEITKYHEDLRRDGERYKYILQKKADGWRVEEIWAWDKYSTAGWRKSRPGDGKPLVPAMTYEGM